MDPTAATLAPDEAAAYGLRVGTALPAVPTLAALAVLHSTHLHAVPFETLDIGLGRPIRLETDALVDKIVRRRRGGYCYELNGLFAALLRAVGYEVDLVSARVATVAGGLTPEFDHLALLVDSPVMAHPVLADVGFGAGFIEPLRLRDGFERRERGTDVGLVGDGETWTYRERPDGGEWAPRYVFTTQPRRLSDFAERNAWQQTSPESHFVRQRLASRLTPAGRVTLSGNRLITTTEGVREERDLDEADVPSVLAEQFGIELDG